MKAFKERLEEAMQIRKISASKLAEKSGLSKSSISRYLSGDYSAGRKNIFLLAKALNVDEGWLMGGDCPMLPQRTVDFALSLNQIEIAIIDKYRNAEDETKHLVEYVLGINKT